jgi:DivIVA domain-containing protein
VALAREDIVRTDFEVERRGYSPADVDRHLQRIATEVEALHSAGKSEGKSLAGAAGQRVQAIVDAAESTAAEIERDARDEAARIRGDASREAKERVEEVRAAAAKLRTRIDELQDELGSVFDELRANTGRLSDGLVALEREAEAVGSQGGDAAPAPAPDLEEEPAPRATVEEGAHEEGEDAQNARLVALNMALNGASRSETERYLAENFSIEDSSALLDDVYAQSGG